MHRFWYIRPLKLPWPWNPGQGSLKIANTVGVTPRSGDVSCPKCQFSYPICPPVTTFGSTTLSISAPNIGVYYCQQLTLSVYHTPPNCFFVSRWNWAIFCPSVLHVALYKTLFFDFWLRPPNAQNLLPKICTKSPISRLVWQINRRCLGLPGGFRGWLTQWNHAKCCGADPCCRGNEIWATSGDPVAYRLVNSLLAFSQRCILSLSKA